jgi:hypothetical protein
MAKTTLFDKVKNTASAELTHWDNVDLVFKAALGAAWC